MCYNFSIINLIHCRLLPTRPFSERSPTFGDILSGLIIYCQWAKHHV
ncbi:MAG: hypothetical protein LBK82_07105 [Planctomycetaceae bacterium]|nr:hypothetical protein [Planctomycetaceae bacterium]